MGKLFLPKETHGLWDARSRALTVFVGEDAYVGFQGSKAELDDLQFSAWGSSLGECATEVYDEGAGRLSTLIDTSRPGTLRLEVTDGSKALVTPITIYIRMRPDYRHMAPEGQLDETACWAACLSWWTRVLPDRTTLGQRALVNQLGVGLWNKSSGTINPAGLETLVARQNCRMRTLRVAPGKLRDYMGYFPMILGFTAAGGFAHMNVLCGYNAGMDTVDTMEPMYPDPIFSSEFEQMEGAAGIPLFYNKATGAPFVYNGAVRTGISLGSFAPMTAGNYWIGFPQEYTAAP